MMESMESRVPPGFRFHPTDEELVGYYLRKKVASQKIDLDVIRDIDLYRIEPWDLIEKCWIGYEEQKEWYFFSHKDKKYPTGTRTNRATMSGFWKATGRDKAVYDKKLKLIGMRKTLVFYKGRAPSGHKTDWIMHEYRLESNENAPPQEEGWVVCRAFKKRMTSQTEKMESRESTYSYIESCSVSSVVDPLEYIPRQPSNFLNQSFTCKKEKEAENLLFAQSEQFVQLPELESPSLPLIKRPISSVSPLSENNGEEEKTIRCDNGSDNNNSNKVSDWRALDKFVASQLSQGEKNGSGGDGMSSFLENENSSTSDLSFLLFQNDGEEGNKLNEFLNSDYDIGFAYLINENSS